MIEVPQTLNKIFFSHEIKKNCKKEWNIDLCVLLRRPESE